MLRDPQLRSDARANLRIIKRSGEHLMDIINNILDMARIEAGHLQLTPKAFSVRNLVDDLEAMFRLRAEAKTLRFDIELDDALQECIVADEGKVGQVLINLLENAVKFTERGRVGLRVSIRPRADARLQFSAEVEDTGIGLSPEERSKLFQPFAQNESGQRIQPGGTGLGLAISRGIARAMGGDITVGSEPGLGSRFVFDVPVEKGFGYEARARGTGPDGRVTGIDSPGEAPRILIADDVADSREWLGNMLLALGFSVRAVESGEAVFDAWTEWRPRLILMPVTAGREAARRIRAHPRGKEAVMIALTADAREFHRRTALENGFDDFIAKPCGEEELLEKIRTHLGIVYIRSADRTGQEAGATRNKSQPKIPASLVRRMRKAILHGDKALLDDLIAKVAAKGEVQCAAALGEMADMYQYDGLTEFLDRL
jgi:CheY-like chemotaxis protein